MLKFLRTYLCNIYSFAQRIPKYNLFTVLLIQILGNYVNLKIRIYTYFS